MERAMSVEEKIRKAEEIYARRHEQDYRSNATVHLNGKDKKEIKLFKKIIKQIVVCLLIYFIVYSIQNNNYIFSEDFIKKAKEILSYDTNFEQLYNNVKSGIENVFKGNNGEKSIGGSEDKTKENNTQSNTTQNTTKSTTKKTTQSDTKQSSKLTEEEQQILKIKNTTKYIKPVQGVISSRYGKRNPTTSTVPKNHTGTDIAANLGTKIVSSTDGEVVVASSEGDYGKHLKIKIRNVTLVYAHCSKLFVKKGDKVKQGQKIAEVGSTGNSTGPHLHFEIRLNEKTVDPEKILKL